MRIGIAPDYSLNPLTGGSYQYTETMVRTLFEFSQQSRGDEFIVLAEDPDHPLLAQLRGRRWKLKRWGEYPWQERMNKLRQFVGEGPHREAWRWLRRRLQRTRSRAVVNGDSETTECGWKLPENIDAVQYCPQLTRWLRSYGIELMVYPAPSIFAFETALPYVMVIHDLQHLVYPEWPEVASDGWAYREYLLRNGARLATVVLADSEIGKEDLLRFYGSHGVTADQIRVLPFLPASYLATDVAPRERERVRRKYGLPDRYLFYPAQFWPYKNHIRIVQALGQLKRASALAAAVVFSGSHSWPLREATFQETMTQARELGIAEQVRYLGYVPDEDVSPLYAEAEALIMPTFLGPTNIPPLEAWSCGCPVITSDIRGIREQMGDAALLVDPYSVESIARAIDSFWRDHDLRREMIVRGRQRLASYTPADYASRLRSALEEAKDRVRNRRGPLKHAT